MLVIEESDCPAPGDVERHGRVGIEQLGHPDQHVVGAFLEVNPGHRGIELLHIVIRAGQPQEQLGVFLVEIGDCVDRPAVGDVVALATVGKAEGETHLGKLAGEFGVPRLATVAHRGPSRIIDRVHLVVAGLERQPGGRRAGDRVDHAFHLHMHVGAEILLDECPLCFHRNASVRLGVGFVFVAERALRAGQPGSQQCQRAGQARIEAKRLGAEAWSHTGDSCWEEFIALNEGRSAARGW